MTTPILTVKDVASELRCGQDAAYSLVRQIGFRVGVNAGVWRVRREALDKWISEQERNETWERKAVHERASTSAVGVGGLTQIRSTVAGARRERKHLRAHKSGSENESDGPPIRLTQPRTLKRSANG